jgi:hypothetical protein
VGGESPFPSSFTLGTKDGTLVASRPTSPLAQVGTVVGTSEAVQVGFQVGFQVGVSDGAVQVGFQVGVSV